MLYYPEEDQIHNNLRSVELRKGSNRAFDKGERFVGSNDVRHESHKLHPDDSELQSRRRSEMVLPSIERDLLDEHSNQTLLRGQKRQVNPFGSYQPLNRGIQQLPAPSIINLNEYEELPSSKRRRIDNQQTIFVPIEQMDDRQPRYERPHEAVYRGEPGHSVSDKRIVPLPPKEERARSPISHQERRPYSPHKEIKRRTDNIADPVDRYPQPHDHFQIPLSRSENIENLHFPSRVVVAPPPEYSNASLSFLNPSQFAPRQFENSDLGFPPRHNVGVVANSDRIHVNPDRITGHLQPLEVVERSMPSQFNDLSIGNRQREDDRRPNPLTYLPSTGTADFHRRSIGVLTCLFAKATANVHGHAGHAINLLTYAFVTAQDNFRGIMKPLTNAYPHSISERHIQNDSEVQHQPVWPVKQETSSYYPYHHQSFVETERANALERRTPPPALRAAMEPWFDKTFRIPEPK